MPYPFFMLRRRPLSPQLPGLPPRASRSVQSLGWNPLWAVAGTGPRGTPPTSRQSPDPPCARRAGGSNTVSRRRRRPHSPPPRSRRSTTGRGDPRLKQGEPLDSRHLIPHLFPTRSYSPSVNVFPLKILTFLFSSQCPGAAVVGNSAPRPLTQKWGMNIALPPPFLRLIWYCPILSLGEGTENSAGRGMREDDSQLNEPTIQGRGSRGLPAPPRPSLQTTIPIVPLPLPAALHAGV